MEFKDKVKLSLRVDNDIFDNEIEMLISAAVDDLISTGIKADLTEDLVQTAVIMYVKALFGYDNKDSNKQMIVYDSIKRKLALSKEWKE